MIHPTAIIENGAQLASNVEVGAYAYIGKDVSIGPGCIIHHHGVVEGYTIMGENNEVFPFAVIGGKTHDLKFKGGKPGLKIGNNNVFREFTTIHPATNDGEFTTIGNNNNFLAYAHVAHDCQIGNHLIMSSQGAFAGHIVCEDHVVFGWGTGIHQFCRVGEYSMLAGMSRIAKDVPPYTIVEGMEEAKVRAVNTVGLQRNGFSNEDIQLIKHLYKIIYHSQLNKTQAIEKIKEECDQNLPIVKKIIDFFTAESTRGIL